MKKTIITLMCILQILMGFTFSFADEDEMISEKAVVLEVEDESGIDEFDMPYHFQRVKLKILSGKYKDMEVESINNFSDNAVYDIPVKVGEKIVVVIEESEDGSLKVNVADYLRENYVYMLLVVFLISILIVGRYQGIKTILTLGITMVSIYKIMLPMILGGHSPIMVTILVSSGITVTTMLLITGMGKKTISAIAGTISGVVIAGLIALYVGNKVKLTGLSSEEAVMLLYLPGIEFDLKELLFSGILLGALGAVMDVSMSISSAIEEISKANRKIGFKSLFMSGMNVGRDIMGTMSNTLILAYTGSSIPLLLIFMSYQTDLTKIINLDLIATEIIRSLAGSIGLVMTIPITAVISTFLITKGREQSEIESDAYIE